MEITAHIVDRRPTDPLRVIGKRYQPTPPRQSGFTVIVLHATGLHKETFEPMIESLLSLPYSSGQNAGIREVWAVECPNHGESVLLNEDIIERNYANSYDGYIYPRALHTFLTSSPGGVNLLKHKLVIAGHSFGGNAAVLLTTLTPPIQLSSIILLDGTIGPASKERDYMDMVLTQVVWSKPDTWRSSNDALKSFMKAPGYKSWDPRVLQAFVTYAMRAHPASKYPPPYKFNGVTLSCKKTYEAACYRANDHHEAAFKRLHELYADGTPVHLIFSQKDEFNGSGLKEAQMKGQMGGGPASVQWIENASHMFVQQRPEASAKAIWQAIIEHGHDKASRL